MVENDADYHLYDINDTGLLGDRYSANDHDSITRRALAGSIFNGTIYEIIATGLNHHGPGNFCIGDRSYLRLTNIYLFFQKFETW